MTEATLVTRQDESTRVTEVEGTVCTEFKAVHDTNTGGVGPLYLLGQGRWHRFYVDAGLLFWQEGESPDEDNDLLTGDEYVSLGKELLVEGVKLTRAEMKDCTLALEFENGARLTIYCDVQSEFPEVRERRVGQS